jgi:hypothetical protein
LRESAVSLVVAVLVVIGPYNVLPPRSVYLFSIALGQFARRYSVAQLRFDLLKNRTFSIPLFVISPKPGERSAWIHQSSGESNARRKTV